MSVEYTESEEIARTPPAGCTKLPTCPVCLGELEPFFFSFMFWYGLKLRINACMVFFWFGV